MRRALRLAAKGAGNVSPNPMVGAVIVKNGKIIAEGYHRKAGERHAEIAALEKAGRKVVNSTMYVNLEPCTHYGKTPPCVEKIISAGLKRVVIAMKDPNPLVCGKGIKKLKNAGIETEVGLFQEEAESLNEIFIKFIKTGKPFVIVKTAMTLDGKIAAAKQGDSKWISGEKSRKFAHKLRSQVDGILVGINTVVKDDPQLNVRYLRSLHQPKRIIVDSRCRIPLDAKVLSENGDIIIAVAEGCLPGRMGKLKKIGVEVLVVKGSGARVNLTELMSELGKRNVASILIEGGGEIIAGALSSGIVDKLFFFIAPKLIGGRCAITPVEGKGIARISDAIKVRQMRVRRIGEDILIEGYVKQCLQE